MEPLTSLSFSYCPPTIVVEQWGILLQENQWWSSGEYCYKRTSGGAVWNIVTREPVVEQ
jgi:hypothetical protein